MQVGESTEDTLIDPFIHMEIDRLFMSGILQSCDSAVIRNSFRGEEIQ